MTPVRRPVHCPPPPEPGGAQWRRYTRWELTWMELAILAVVAAGQLIVLIAIVTIVWVIIA